MSKYGSIGLAGAGVDWIDLAQERDKWRAVAKSPNYKNAVCFLTSWGTGIDVLLCMQLGMQLNSECPK